MPLDTYVRVNEERAGKSLIRKHIEQKDTCPVIRRLATEMILEFNSFVHPTLDEIEEMIKEISFKKKV
jgi:hypothetical protein